MSCKNQRLQTTTKKTSFFFHTSLVTDEEIVKELKGFVMFTPKQKNKIVRVIGSGWVNWMKAKKRILNWIKLLMCL